MMFGMLFIAHAIATDPTAEVYEMLLKEKDRIISNLCGVIRQLTSSQKVTVINMDMPKTFQPAALLPVEEEMPRNIIFRKYMDGKAIDMRKMRHWIEDHFIGHIVVKYDWFALWRVLCDLRYIDADMAKVSKFVEQMQLWFPDETGNNMGSEMNRYRRGYLGDTPCQRWKRSDFEANMGKKQSAIGFTRLSTLCNDLWNELKTADLKAE